MKKKFDVYLETTVEVEDRGEEKYQEMLDEAINIVEIRLASSELGIKVYDAEEVWENE